MSTLQKLTRREMMFSTAATVGGFGLSVVIPANAIAAPVKVEVPLNAFIAISVDGTVTCIVPTLEMGQGALTSLAMISCDELGADWATVKILPAPYGDSYRRPKPVWIQMASGSTSVRVFYAPLRKAAAAAREMLTSAAAQRWRVSPNECVVEAGKVIHSTSGRTLHFGEVALDASKLPVPQEPVLRTREKLTLIGKPIPRVDIPSIVNGTAQYGVDVKIPGMVYASIRQAPVFGAKLKRVDKASIKGKPGVLGIVELENAAVVIGKTFWEARVAMDALEIEFTSTEADQVSSGSISQAFIKQYDNPVSAVAVSQGDPKFTENAARVIEATYQVPFLAHATMEPMNCTCHVTKDACHIWGPTQTIQKTMETAVQVTGFREDQIHIHPTLMGGGFGRRAEFDYIEQVVQIAKKVGKPVKMIWTREEDMQHDFYRPAMGCRMRGALDSEGRLVALSAKIVGPSVNKRWLPQYFKDNLDLVAVGGMSTLHYAIPNILVSYVYNDLHIPAGYWRSVGPSQNGFFVEAFIDELAQAAGQDPYMFRRLHLEKDERARNVLDMAATKANWSTQAPTGRYRGIAFFECVGSLVSQVVEVSIQDEKVKVHRVVCVVDCGEVVNPDTITAQMEGGVMFALTAALQGEITIEKGRVQQSNFHDHPMLRMKDMPEVEVHIIRSGSPIGGIGEANVPQLAPALVNAIYAATKTRIRNLPVTKNGLRVA